MGIEDVIGEVAGGIGEGMVIGAMARSRSSRGSSSPQNTGSLQTRIAHLEKTLGKTLCICEALWELLRDQKGYTDDVILAKVKQIEMRGGKIAGKNKSRPLQCPQCGRTIAAHHKACMYCGNPNEKSLFAM